MWRILSFDKNFSCYFERDRDGRVKAVLGFGGLVGAPAAHVGPSHLGDHRLRQPSCCLRLWGACQKLISGFFLLRGCPYYLAPTPLFNVCINAKDILQDQWQGVSSYSKPERLTQLSRCYINTLVIVKTNLGDCKNFSWQISHQQLSSHVRTPFPAH